MLSHVNMAWCIQGQVRRSCLIHCQPACSLTEPGWGWSATLAVQCLILSSGLKDYGHLLALVSYRKAPIGVEHACCLTPTDEDSHSATIVVLCFAIVCVCVCVCMCLLTRPVLTRRPRYSNPLFLCVCVCVSE